MRILQFSIIILVAALALALSGCQPPESKFVSNKKTDELVSEVGKAVKQHVDENFGSPTNPIAWLRMPINFGTLTGKVEGFVDSKQGTYRLKVAFDAAGDNQEQTVDWDRLNFDGLALRWTKGAYAGGIQIDGGEQDGQRMFALQTAAYDQRQSILTLRQRMQTPPADGDTFEIIGHNLASGRQLYAVHCQHCHGTSGDGNGPTAKYLNPLPRDYRLGKFKFKSTLREDRPTDDDLERIVKQGIPGTYMPSFLLLEDSELEALVQYVKWLSMRGEYEIRLVNQLYSSYEKKTFDETIKTELETALEDYDPASGESKPDKKSIKQFLLQEEGTEFTDLPEISDQESQALQAAWLKVQDQSKAVIVPSVARIPDSDASQANGRKLFIKNCAACHGMTGRGNGEQVDAYMVNDKTRERYPEPGLFDDWGNSIKPRDLKRGIYRGGRRPVDLYRRFYEGINGTPMPPFKGKIPDAQIWDLVNYVYHIPFDKSSPVGESSRKQPQPTAAKQPSPLKKTSEGS